MWASALATQTWEAVECLVYLDEDDPHLAAYEKINGIKVTVGPRISISEAWNLIAAKASGSILMLCADDLLFRTEGWDKLIAQEFEKVLDRIVLVYGRDGYQDEALATHPFLHRNWMKTVGYFVPPYFTASYDDTWLNDVADMIGRKRFVPEVLIEHMHPAAGKALSDQTYDEALGRFVSDDMAGVYASLEDERRKWAELLRGAME